MTTMPQLNGEVSRPRVSSELYQAWEAGAPWPIRPRFLPLMWWRETPPTASRFRSACPPRRMRYPRAKRRISPIAATSPAAAVTFTGNGDQPLDCRIAENDLRHLAVEQGQVLSQAIEL